MLAGYLPLNKKGYDMYTISFHSLMLNALHTDILNYRIFGSHNLEDCDSVFTSFEFLLNVYTREYLKNFA